MNVVDIRILSRCSVHPLGQEQTLRAREAKEKLFCAPHRPCGSLFPPGLRFVGPKGRSHEVLST